jgi:3-dehydroquinate synthase
MEDSQFSLSIKSASSVYSLEERHSLDIDFFKAYDLVVIDDNVLKFHDIKLEIPYVSILANETAKEYSSVTQLFEVMLSYRINRKSRILAVGGGVVQDIVTFAASLFFRGISWDFLPTTLLAMGDSCIGGKSSINFKSTKNVIGNFYPPEKIFIYVDFLRTLNDSNLKSGIGELYHYAFLNTLQDFEWYNDTLSPGYDKLNLSHFRSLIFKTLCIKKEIIEEDEFDKDRRLFNNWGHTIGHAIEAVSNFRVPHGQAVLAGILFELKLLELINEKSYRQSINIVERLNSEYGYNPLPNLISNELFEVIRKDKKNLPGRIAVDFQILTH